MHQNTLRGLAVPGPAGGDYALPRPPSRNGGLLLREGGKRGLGPTYKGREGRGGYFSGGQKGGERRWKGRGVNSPQSLKVKVPS